MTRFGSYLARLGLTSRFACVAFVLVGCRSSLPVLAIAAAPPAEEPRERRVGLPGDGTWDHIIAASAARRLYVSHATHIDVLDLDSDTLVGVLDSLPGVHGVALDEYAHRGYTSNEGDSSITVFDTRSLQVLRRLHVRADSPDGIVFDPASRRVFAMHGNSPSLSVFDAGADTLRNVLQLGGSPDGGIPDGHGQLYVTLKDRSELLVIDTHRLSILQRWPLAPCAGPDAIAIDTVRGRVVLGCDSGTVVSVETSTGTVHPGFAIGTGVDGVSIGGNMILASTADGVVTVARCQQDRCAVERTIRTMRGSGTSALDSRTLRLYVPYDVRVAERSDSLRARMQNTGGTQGFGVQIIPLRRTP